MYDEHYDCVICPEYQTLPYRTTNRDGYREYRSDPHICVNCPTRHLCTHSKECVKTVQRHIWKGYEELADDVRYTPEYQQLYKRGRRPLKGSLPTPKKNTPCVIPSTEAWPRLQTG